MEDRPQKRLKMDSSGANEMNIGFGFNDINLSDRVLRLEVILRLPSNTSDASNTSKDGDVEFKFKTFHINSLLLASKSQFFYKLFKNGMTETQQGGEVALRIHEFEEAAFMDLLKFIYEHSVNASSALDLLDVLEAANKFEVPYCVRYCVDLLLKLPRSTELALDILELPSCVLANEVIQTLVESAKSYLCTRYRDFTKRRQYNDALGLTLFGVEIVIGNDDLQVNSEDVVCDFILKWGEIHCQEQEERRETLTKLLLKFVCLPKMSIFKLKTVIECTDFDYEKESKPVLDALFSKDQDVPLTTKYEYPRRIYSHRDVKVVQLQLAPPHRVVYFDLTKKECADLKPFKILHSQAFFLGGRKMSLYAQRRQEEGPISLSVYVRAGTQSCTLDFEISVIKKSSKELFTSLGKAYNTLIKTNNSSGFGNPFKISWAEFMSEESEYFIDGILHLRFNLTLIS